MQATPSNALLFYLPEPIGWIALTEKALCEARARAAEAIPSGEHRARPEGVSTPSMCVSAEEAARALGVEASWLMRQARLRRVPFLKVGKYNRFCVDALRAHLAKAPTK